MNSAPSVSEGSALYVSALARLRCRGERKFLAMLHAYCDESYDGDINNASLYVVAGFIGEAHQWELLEKLWRQDMKSLDIEKIGCHASKCANGAGPYKHMSGQRRAEIQDRLIVDIVASKLFGVVSIMDMRAYGKVKAKISECFNPQDRQYNEPHVLAVRQCVQHMCLATRHATDEPIAFVVDRNAAFGKRARAWYDIAKKNPNQDNVHFGRLGPYAEDSRENAIGLQAADMLAYAGMRQAAGRKGWQWDKLMDGKRIGEPFTSDEGFWNTVTEQFLAAREESGSE